MSRLSAPAPQIYDHWRYNIQQHAQHAPAHHKFFWLIDPSAHDELPGLIWKLDPQPEAWPLYMNSYMEEAINSGPFMVPYRPGSEFTKWVLQEMRWLPLGCLIEVESASVHTVFEHLQNLLECANGDGEASVFRFYDPRITYGISTYEDQSMAPRILGPVLRLDAWEPGRCVPVFMGTGADNATRSPGMEHYDAAFFEHIWDEVLFHTIIGTLGRESGMALRAMPLPEAYQLMQQTSTTLIQFGYSDRNSLAYGASFSAYYGLSVWEMPAVRQALEKRPAQAPLREVLESVNI